VLYGTGAIGGTINVVPRRPDPMVRSYEVQAGGGSFNTYRLYGDATGPINNKLSYRADVAYNHSDGWIERGKSETLAFTGALRFDVTPTLRFMLSDDYGRQDPMNYYGDPLIKGALDPALRKVNYNVLDAAQHYEDNWLQLKAEWNPLADWSFRNTLYYLTSERHWNNEENFAYQAATGKLLRNGYLEIFHHEQQTGDHGDATWRTKFAGHDNALVAGFDVNHVRFQNVSNSPFPGSTTIDPYHYVPDLFLHLAPTIPSVQTTTDQHSLYAEDRIELLEGLNLSTGLRADHYDLTRLDPRANTTTKHKYDTISWRAGLVKSLPRGLMAYAQYSFATDPVSSLITLSPAQQIFDLTTGRQVEVGLKQAIPGGWGEWTLAAYQIVKNNLLQPVPGNPTLQQQIGQQSSTGLEASFAISPVRGLRIEANGTVLRAKFDSFGENVSGTVISRAGNRPPNIPQLTGNAFVTWDVYGPWQVRASVRAVDKRYTNNANTLQMPGYAVFDAGVKYQLTPRMSLDLNLYNVADKVYPNASYNGGNQWILGQPRAVEIAFHGRF
jgi:iron complex outermembrane receptor protein